MEPPVKKFKNHSCNYNKSEAEGAAAQNSYLGMFYHTFLAMKIMLVAFLERSKQKLPSFDLTMEDRERGGKFDDIVCGYELPTQATGTIYIQAKHKQAKSPTKKIFLRLQTLRSNEGDFSIPVYFMYYLEQFQKRTDNSLHTFMLCTNAKLEEDVINTLGLKDQSTNDRIPPIISTFCKSIHGECYAFSNEHSKTSDPHQNIETLLRDATIKELAKALLKKPSTEEQKKLKQSIVKAYSYLIARCVNQDATGKLRFNEKFLETNDTSTAMGKLHEAINPKQNSELELFLDDIDPISNDGQIDECLSYETVDKAMKHFFQEFLLITGTMNEAELGKTAHEPMPDWVDNKEQVSEILYSKANKGLHGNTIEMKELQDLFIAAKPNENYNKILDSTNKYVQNLRKMYNNFVFKRRHLENSKLFKFITNKSPVDEADFIYHCHSQSNLQLKSIIVKQTLNLTYHYLFVDGSSSECNEFGTLTADVVEFIADVDMSDTIIVILGELNDDSLKQTVLKKRLKVIVIEEMVDETKVDDSERELNDRVGDLSKKSKDLQLSKNWQCFGTSVALNRIVKDDDSLNFLCDVLKKCDETMEEGEENVYKQKFKEIRSWYVPRSIEPHNENVNTSLWDLDGISEDSFAYVSENFKLYSDVTDASDTNTSDATHSFTNQSKVSIIVDDAGHGKSTYCTYLASRLSEDPSLCVIRMNALNHATQFEELQKKYPKPLDDTDTVRIFYYLLLLNSFATNINNQSDENNEKKRKRAIQMAEIIIVTNGQVVLDEQQAVILNFTSEELLWIRSFQDIFNSFNQFDLIFDGFDEIAPFSKEFVMAFLAKLSTLDGIRKLYLSSRPYNFVDELKQSFNDCEMYKLKPFTKKDILGFLNNFLQTILPNYSQCSTDQKKFLVETVYYRYVQAMGDLIRIPLLLHMGCTILCDKIKENINCTSQTVKINIFNQDHIDEYYIISEFVEQKITILNMQKRGFTKNHLHNPAMKTLILRDNKQLKDEHALLALFAMFNENVRNKLLKDSEIRKASCLLQDVAQGKEKTGIILGVVGNVPQFCHRLFAEYFAAHWLFAESGRMKDVPFFRSWSYWGSELKRTRRFFDRIVLQESSDCELHLAMLIGSKDQIRRLCNNSEALTKKDAVGRLPLHLAICNTFFMPFSLEKDDESIISKTSVEEIETQDDLFQWTAIHYAFVTREISWVDELLKLNAKVDVDILLSQIMSNNLEDQLQNAEDYARWLADNEHTKMIADQLQMRVVDNLMKRFNICMSQHELDDLSLIELCAKRNMYILLREFLSQRNVKISPEMAAKLYKIAFNHKSYDIVWFLFDESNILFPEDIEIAQLIAVIKFTIKKNHLASFVGGFQHACSRIHIEIDTEKHKINHDVSSYYGHNTPAIDSNFFPFGCCFSEEEVEDYTNKESVIHDILASAVSEGNVVVVDYVVRITNTTITNELIMKIMDRSKGLFSNYHKMAMPAFLYFLDNTTNLDSVDENGRNLIHWNVKNGCFFMLPCLIAKGFDPKKKDNNGKNVFDYADSCEKNDRSEAIMKYLESIKSPLV